MSKKILYVTSELYPYQDDTIARAVNKMAIKMHSQGNDVRIFMPKFGVISERKFQLHEVIRLSGMNIIINDLDQPLIIKVASLPGERLQVYFIDNQEYFKRKEMFFDEENVAFMDNDERAMFFARGVIETVKKLNWVPDVIHLNGWMASFVPFYIKNFYKNDAFFADTKFVSSLYNEPDATLYPEMKQKIDFDGITDVKNSTDATFRSLTLESLQFVDVVMKGEEFLDAELEDVIASREEASNQFVEFEEITY